MRGIDSTEEGDVKWLLLHDASKNIAFVLAARVSSLHLPVKLFDIACLHRRLATPSSHNAKFVSSGLNFLNRLNS